MAYINKNTLVSIVGSVHLELHHSKNLSLLVFWAGCFAGLGGGACLHSVLERHEAEVEDLDKRPNLFPRVSKQDHQRHMSF